MRARVHRLPQLERMLHSQLEKRTAAVEGLASQLTELE